MLINHADLLCLTQEASRSLGTQSVDVCLLISHIHMCAYGCTAGHSLLKLPFVIVSVQASKPLAGLLAWFACNSLVLRLIYVL